MRFVVAGGGVAGLSAALALARAGHRAVVLERDEMDPAAPPNAAFAAERPGIPHYQQPHAFLPRGRQVMARIAPDVLQALLDNGADEHELAAKLTGLREPGDEDLVYMSVRRPLIEWALRRAASREPGIELRAGTRVSGLITEDGRATGVALEDGAPEHGDVVVDALGRYRPPVGWPRPAAEAQDCGAIYYCRYFRWAEGAGMPEGPWLINPRGDLGYMGFNTFRGDNRTFAVIVLVPTADRELRILRDENAWTAAVRAMHPTGEMTLPDNATPITPVMPMGGLSNVFRAVPPDVRGVVAVGDAVCHTDPSFAFGLSFSLIHAEALAEAATLADGDLDALATIYYAAIEPELRERHAMVRDTDDARARRWAGEPLDPSRRDGCYPLFAFAAAIAAAPHDDHVLRRTIRRLGLLDRTAVFDSDDDLHNLIEQTFAQVMKNPPPPPGPPRDELLEIAQAATR